MHALLYIERDYVFLCLDIGEGILLYSSHKMWNVPCKFFIEGLVMAIIHQIKK
jgi:hypothetical protein